MPPKFQGISFPEHNFSILGNQVSFHLQRPVSSAIEVLGISKALAGKLAVNHGTVGAQMNNGPISRDGSSQGRPSHGLPFLPTEPRHLSGTRGFSQAWHTVCAV